MASPNIYQSGVGGTSGATLATLAPLFCSGDIWYVHSPSGSDAVSPRGKERIRPLATLAQAITNAAAGDAIVCLSGHSESITSAQVVSKAGLTFLGEGSGASRPRFTRAHSLQLFSLQAAGIIWDNFYFPGATVSGSSGNFIISASATNCAVLNCYFELNGNEGASGLSINGGGTGFRLEDTQFVSASTTPATAPARAFHVVTAANDVTLKNVTFDGGVSGWAGYAWDGAAALTRFRATNVDLLDDSDVTFATGTSGVLHVRNTTGSARVVWTA